MTVIELHELDDVIAEFEIEEDSEQEVEHALCRYCYPPELAPHPEFVAACGATVEWPPDGVILPQCRACVEVVSRLAYCPRCGG